MQQSEEAEKELKWSKWVNVGYLFTIDRWLQYKNTTN